jgi:ABC-2 type transport system permease protein
MKIIISIFIKELIQLRRDRRLFGIVFLAPVIQLVLLGYAANMDVNTVHTAVFDQDRSATSRDFILKFERSGYFKIDDYVDSYNQITEDINKGRALWALVIPRNFEENIKRMQTAPVQAIFDGSDGNKSSIALGYIQGIVSEYSKDVIVKTVSRAGMKNTAAGNIIPQVRVWYNPELKTRVFMLPNIMGLILVAIITVLMTMAIVKEREIGTLEQLIVTPIKPWQLIIGKTIPFIMVGFLDSLVAIIVMVLWFGIVIKGSFMFLLLASLIFVLSILGIGLFVSTISKTQQQAMMVAQFGILLPMIYLSGFAFPIENMPGWLQPITYLIPLRYYIIILRGIILRGASFIELLPDTIMLLVLGVIILAASVFRFRKKLE